MKPKHLSNVFAAFSAGYNGTAFTPESTGQNAENRRAVETADRTTRAIRAFQKSMNPGS